MKPIDNRQGNQYNSGNVSRDWERNLISQLGFGKRRGQRGKWENYESWLRVNGKWSARAEAEGQAVTLADFYGK